MAAVKHKRGMTLITAMMVMTGVAGTARASSALDAYASPVRDITAESRVVSRDMDALKKISGEFAQSYRFASSTVYYKEPGKLRVESKAGVVNVKYVINGDRKVLKAGVINKRSDISQDPGKRQSALTVGLVTPSWASLLNTEYKGDRTIGGNRTAMIEAHYKVQPHGSYFRLYMDPARKYVVRSEQFHGDGRLKVTMDFVEPKKFNGIWVPTRIKVFNAHGELGAVTAVQNIKVNSGLSDDLFQI